MTARIIPLPMMRARIIALSAQRLARIEAEHELRRAGRKPSQVSMKELSAIAQAMLAVAP